MFRSLANDLLGNTMLFWNLFLDGLHIWAKLSLLAIGYALVYVELRMINFAYGEIVTFAAYISYFLSERVILPFFLCVTLALAASVALSLIIERFAYRPLYGRDRLSLLISSIAVSIILQNSYAVVFGSNTMVYQSVALPLWVPPTISATLIVLLLLLLKQTRFGRQVKGVADSRVLAEIVGVNSTRTIQGIFVLGGVLACGTGIIEGMDHGVEPTMGFNLALAAFIAAVLGGLRSVTGAIGGSLAFSMILAFSAPFVRIPRELLIFLALIAVVLIRQRLARGIGSFS